MGLFDTVGDWLGKAQDFGNQVQGGLEVLTDIKGRLEDFGNFGTPSTPAFNPATFGIPLPNYQTPPGTAYTAPPAPAAAPSGTVLLVGLALLALVVLKT